MNKTFKILLLVLLAVVVVQSIAVAVLYRRNVELANNIPFAFVIAKPCFDWSALPPKTCVELLSALILDEVTFDNETLSECLTHLSDRTRSILGKGISFTIRGADGMHTLPHPRVSLKLKNITFREILKYLGDASGAKIEITEYGIFATYGKSPEGKP